MPPEQEQPFRPSQFLAPDAELSAADELEELRCELDEVNRQLAEVLQRRFERLEQVASCKARLGREAVDRQRRAQMLADLRETLPPAWWPWIEPIFHSCFDQAERFVGQRVGAHSRSKNCNTSL